MSPESTRATELTQLRMSALIELAIHNARCAMPDAPSADVRSRARGDLRNAVARLSQEHSTGIAA